MSDIAPEKIQHIHDSLFQLSEEIERFRCRFIYVRLASHALNVRDDFCPLYEHSILNYEDWARTLLFDFLESVNPEKVLDGCDGQIGEIRDLLRELEIDIEPQPHEQNNPTNSG
ncbi:MAG: hypothetical protein SXA11_06635 [Cyanobacteriota bacterium]|nr:hypothetical protein [Cyanobacteriota bacterium]